MLHKDGTTKILPVFNIKRSVRVQVSYHKTYYINLDFDNHFSYTNGQQRVFTFLPVLYRFGEML